MRFITSIKINILAIIGLLSILISGYVVEFYFQEPPCPLCLLQRLGFLATAFGFALNLKFGNKMQHYGLSLIAILFTASVAARQILLHIFTQSGVYGPSFFGLHLYTWSFLISVLIIIFIAFALTLEPPRYGVGDRPKWVNKTINIVMGLLIAITLANAVTAFLICGFGECPENPAKYTLFHSAEAENDVVKAYYFCS